MSIRMLYSRRAVATIAILAVVSVLAGCGITVPADPDSTLDRVDAGVVRVGASPADGLVRISDSGTAMAVDGPLPDLVEGFAAERGAKIVWTVDSEEALVGALEDGSLDLAVGGFTSDTPWIDRASVTRGFPDITGTDGSEVVLLLPLGENAMQAAVEAYLDRQVRE